MSERIFRVRARVKPLPADLGESVEAICEWRRRREAILAGEVRRIAELNRDRDAALYGEAPAPTAPAASRVPAGGCPSEARHSSREASHAL